MEDYLNNLEAAKKYWLDIIKVDTDFFESLWESYSTDLYNLFKRIQGRDIVTIFPFSVPSEIIDFLDGNGFSIEYDSNHNLQLTRI